MFKVCRPIALLRIIRKALESVLVNRLAWAAEIHALLPNLHLGSRRDAIMYLSFGCWLLIGSTKHYSMDLIHISDITLQGDIYTLLRRRFPWLFRLWRRYDRTPHIVAFKLSLKHSGDSVHSTTWYSPVACDMASLLSDSIKSVVVIGGCGFIAFHIVCHFLLESSCISVSVISHNPRNNRLPQVLYFVGGIADLDNMRDLILQIRPSIIVHAVSPSFISATVSEFENVIIQVLRIFSW